ncbi:MAG: hypothetical protein ACXADF_17020 [Candidatus Thorarchaeota archaeon]|jgi:hypothetical protein
MGQDVRGDSRVCRTPPGPRKDLNQLLRPRTMFVAVSLTLILTTAGLVWMRPPPYIPPFLDHSSTRGMAW